MWSVLANFLFYIFHPPATPGRLLPSKVFAVVAVSKLCKDSLEVKAPSSVSNCDDGEWRLLENFTF